MIWIILAIVSFAVAISFEDMRTERPGENDLLSFADNSDFPLVNANSHDFIQPTVESDDDVEENISNIDSQKDPPMKVALQSQLKQFVQKRPDYKGDNFF